MSETERQSRLKGHDFAGIYLVRNLTSGLVAYFAMCDCNYETPWSSTQDSTMRYYRAHRADERAKTKSARKLRHSGSV